MRYSLKLCKDEIDFRENRKPFLFQAMRKLLGPRGPKSMDEVSLFFYFFPCNFLLTYTFRSQARSSVWGIQINNIFVFQKLFLCLYIDNIQQLSALYGMRY